MNHVYRPVTPQFDSTWEFDYLQYQAGTLLVLAVRDNNNSSYNLMITTLRLAQ